MILAIRDRSKIRGGGGGGGGLVQTNLVPRAFPLRKWVPTHVFKGKALGTRLGANMGRAMVFHASTKGRVKQFGACH